MEVVNVIFIVGPPFSGKTEFIKTFDNDRYEKIVECYKENWKKPIIDINNTFEHCPFPTEETKEIKLLYNKKQLTKKQYIDYTQKIYLDHIAKKVQLARTNNSILVMEDNPIYAKWIRLHSDNNFGAVADNSVVSKFIEWNLSPCFTCFLMPIANPIVDSIYDETYDETE